MRLLVLGGTKFLGRAAVEAALARGHEVTLFNRGETNPGLFPEVEKLRGDRDGDLARARGARWDAVIDPSGYVPRVVRASAELLARAASTTTSSSRSISVYSELPRDYDESTPARTARGSRERGGHARLRRAQGRVRARRRGGLPGALGRHPRRA